MIRLNSAKATYPLNARSRKEDESAATEKAKGVAKHGEQHDQNASKGLLATT